MAGYGGTARDIDVLYERVCALFANGSRTAALFANGSRTAARFANGSRTAARFANGSRTDAYSRYTPTVRESTWYSRSQSLASSPCSRLESSGLRVASRA